MSPEHEDDMRAEGRILEEESEQEIMDEEKLYGK